MLLFPESDGGGEKENDEVDGRRAGDDAEDDEDVEEEEDLDQDDYENAGAYLMMMKMLVHACM